MRLCVSFFPSEYPSWLGKALSHSFYNLLCKASNYKRNPRNLAYTRALVTQTLGEGCLIVKARHLSESRLKDADEIVLLWPDSNGYGWFGVERRILAWKKKHSKIMILNGRRRCFNLSRSLWIMYLLRRFMERFWIGEIIFSLFFLCISPFLMLWDFIRGKQ